jgi:arylsulfatase A-like enzyme
MGSMISPPRCAPLLLFLASFLFACRPDAPPPMKLEDRFIADDSAAIQESLSAIYQRERVFKWEFKTAEDLKGWIAHDFDMKYQLLGDRLLMQSSKSDSCLWRPVDFDADEIDEIQIIRSPLTGDTVQFFFQREGEPTFTAENMFSAKVPDPGGKLLQTFTFRLRGHPRWKGKIAYLRFDLTELPAHRVGLLSIETFRYKLDQQQLAHAVANPMRIDLGYRELLAKLSPPGLPWVHEVSVPKNGRLTFSYGVQQRMGVPITFKARFDEDGGAPSTPLFAATVDPETQGRTWQEESVDLSKLAGKKGKIVFETEADKAFDPLRGFPAWGSPEISAPGDTGKWNLLWIVIDTLRADRLSVYGYEKNTSPNLKKFARQRATVFENTIAAAPWTLPSHVSMFSGLGALEHGINYLRPAPTSMTMVAEHLRKNGYSTLAVTGGAYLSTRFGLSQGFDRFAYVTEQAMVNDPSGSKDLPSTLAGVADWLGKKPAEPFFFFVHTYVVHTPYVAQQPYFEELYGQPRPAGIQSISSTLIPAAPDNGWQQLSGLQVNGPDRQVLPYSPDQRPLLDSLYDSGVRAADEAIGKILGQLEAQGMRERTMVVITSDHGESLGEHGASGHFNLYDEVLKVPLLIAWPDGRGRGERIATQVRLIDLPATLTESLGLPPMPQGEGRSVLPLLDDPGAEFPRSAESLAASANQGISLRIANRQKFIYQHSLWDETHGRRELYDLVADPAELQNLAGREPERDNQLVRELAERYEKKSGNLLIEAQNRQDVPLIFRMRGLIAHVFTAKGFELPKGAVSWEAGEIVVTVPPRQELRFFLDGHSQGELVVRLFDGRGGQPLLTGEEILAVEQLDQPKSFRWKEAGWQTSQAGALGEQESGATFRWHGLRRIQQQATPSEVDEELNKQLEALGYVK